MPFEKFSTLPKNLNPFQKKLNPARKKFEPLPKISQNLNLSKKFNPSRKKSQPSRKKGTAPENNSIPLETSQPPPIFLNPLEKCQPLPPKISKPTLKISQTPFSENNGTPPPFLFLHLFFHF